MKLPRALMVGLVIAGAGCRETPATVFERISESRRLTSEILVQFTKAADATNRAVMAGTEQASAAFAHEADVANGAIQKATDQLQPLLTTLGYSAESSLLEEFVGRFSKYRDL